MLVGRHQLTNRVENIENMHERLHQAIIDRKQRVDYEYGAKIWPKRYAFNKSHLDAWNEENYHPVPPQEYVPHLKFQSFAGQDIDILDFPTTRQRRVCPIEVVPSCTSTIYPYANPPAA
jgi:hypothetical protein